MMEKPMQNITSTVALVFQYFRACIRVLLQLLTFRSTCTDNIDKVFLPQTAEVTTTTITRGKYILEKFN